MATLAEAHIEAQARLRARLEQIIGNLWTGLPGYDEANVPQFIDPASAVVVATQRASVAITSAYLARVMDGQVPSVDVDALLSQLRAEASGQIQAPAPDRRR